MALNWDNTLELTTPDPSGDGMWSGSPGLVSLGGERALLVYGQAWKTDGDAHDYPEVRLWGRILTGSNPIAASDPVVLWSSVGTDRAPGESLQIVPVGNGRFAVNWSWADGAPNFFLPSTLVLVDANGADPVALDAVMVNYDADTRMCRLGDGLVAVFHADQLVEGNSTTGLGATVYGCTTSIVNHGTFHPAAGLGVDELQDMRGRGIWFDEVRQQGYLTTETFHPELSRWLPSVDRFTLSGTTITFQGPVPVVGVPAEIETWAAKPMPVVWRGGVFLTMRKPYPGFGPGFPSVLARLEHTTGGGLTFTTYRNLQVGMETIGPWEQELAPRALTADGKVVQIELSTDEKPGYPGVTSIREPTLTFDFMGTPLVVQAPVGFDADDNSLYYERPPREHLTAADLGTPVAATPLGAIVAQWTDHATDFYALYATYIAPDLGLSGVLAETRRTFYRNRRT